MSDELKELDEEMTLPQIEKVETREDENKQMSMDPSIQEEEEALIAQKENDEKLCAILEGLLFLVGDEGLTIEQASQSIDISEEKVESLFDSLQQYYTDDSRGFEIERYGQKYRFLSKAFVHESAKKLFAIEKVSKLSNAALETLAIIAYKQPITRVEIEEIRGVGADVMIRKLEARGLIKEDGRSDAPGRPFLYSVTDDFMDAFKLLSLDELPDLPEFNKEEGNEDLFNQ
jgi:segregation and condensation protein B